jgi:hypothetical protein
MARVRMRRRPRPSGPGGEASSTGRGPSFRGSCTECRRAHALRLDCCRPLVAAKSPSDAPCAHRTPSQSHLRSAALRPQASENQERFHQERSRGFLRIVSSGHTLGTARKGESYTRVPSLDGGCAVVSRGPRASGGTLLEAFYSISNTASWERQEENKSQPRCFKAEVAMVGMGVLRT